MIQILIKEKNLQKAVQFIQQRLDDMIHDRVSFEEFILSASMKQDYKNPNQKQSIIARKIQARNPGSEPKAGDRVRWVVIETPESKRNPKIPLFKHIEDADYAKTHNLKLDKCYYLEHQCVKPLTSVLGTFMENPDIIFQPYRETLQREQKNDQDIRGFFGGTKSKITSTPVFQYTTQLQTTTRVR